MLPTGLLGESFLPLGLQGVVVRGLPHPCSSSCSWHRGSLTPSRTGRRNQKMWVLPPPQVSGDARLILAPLGTSGPHHGRLHWVHSLQDSRRMKVAWPGLRVCCLGLLHRGASHRHCTCIQGSGEDPTTPELAAVGMASPKTGRGA